jgi:hypothetical protein
MQTEAAGLRARRFRLHGEEAPGWRIQGGARTGPGWVADCPDGGGIASPPGPLSAYAERGDEGLDQGAES